VGQQSASAQKYYVFGQGFYSCGDYLQAFENEQKVRPQNAKPNSIYTLTYRVYSEWLDGYLTGLNMAGNEESNRSIGHTNHWLDWMIWTDNWCRLHPTDKFADAAYALSAELKQRSE
jgi:hypothetical protein